MYITPLEQFTISKFKKSTLRFRIRNYKSLLNLSKFYNLTPIYSKNYSSKSDDAASTAQENANISVASTTNMPVLTHVSELCFNTPRFKGGQLMEGMRLQRSVIQYVHNKKHVKFDTRGWAYIIVDYQISHDGREYTSIALPLFGISNLLK